MSLTLRILNLHLIIFYISLICLLHYSLLANTKGIHEGSNLYSDDLIHLAEISTSKHAKNFEYISQLQHLKSGGFEPKVIYDIGSGVLNWTAQARAFWPQASYHIFDSNLYLEDLYRIILSEEEGEKRNIDYHLHFLSDKSDKYCRICSPLGGHYDYSKSEDLENYYYDCLSTTSSNSSSILDTHLANDNNNHVICSSFFITKTLDSLIKELNLPLPDLINIDIPKSGIVDVITGGLDAISSADRLLIRGPIFNSSKIDEHGELSMFEDRTANCSSSSHDPSCKFPNSFPHIVDSEFLLKMTDGVSQFFSYKHSKNSVQEKLLVSKLDKSSCHRYKPNFYNKSYYSILTPIKNFTLNIVISFVLDRDSLRNSYLSYESMHLSGGFSGSETAMLEVGKYLVSKGHNVTILCNFPNLKSFEFGDDLVDKLSYTSFGIQFISVNNIIDDEKVRNLTSEAMNNADIFCPYYIDGSISIYNAILSFLSPNTVVWIWHQYWLGGIDMYFKYAKGNDNRLMCSFVSKFAYKLQSQLSDTTVCDSILITGNAINPHLIEDTGKHDDRASRGRWIFHAKYDRGGHAAIQIFESVRKLIPSAANSIHFASYHVPDQDKVENSNVKSYVFNHGSLSKFELNDLLSQSEYFIYPLVNDASDLIHIDTFAIVILEALARGVIVITWDIANYDEIFGDHIIKIPLKSSISPELLDEYDIMTSSREKSSFFLKNIDFVRPMVDEIVKLDSDVERKHLLRSRGIEFARLYTSSWDLAGENYWGWFNSEFSLYSNKTYKWMHCKKGSGIRIAFKVNLYRQSVNYPSEKLLVIRRGDDPNLAVRQFWEMQILPLCFSKKALKFINHTDDNNCSVSGSNFHKLLEFVQETLVYSSKENIQPSDLQIDLFF